MITMKFGFNSMAVVLDSGDAEALSAFYTGLLGWERIPYQAGDEWIVVVKDTTLALVFQQVDDYKRPVWPGEPNQQQQMMHLDFYVDDPATAIAHALACGATRAQVEEETFWTVMIDPAGHPFCILPKRE